MRNLDLDFCEKLVALDIRLEDREAKSQGWLKKLVRSQCCVVHYCSESCADFVHTDLAAHEFRNGFSIRCNPSRSLPIALRKSEIGLHDGRERSCSIELRWCPGLGSKMVDLGYSKMKRNS